MQRLLKSDLKIKPNKIIKRQLFSEATKNKRFERANMLLKKLLDDTQPTVFRQSTLLKIIRFGRKIERDSVPVENRTSFSIGYGVDGGCIQWPEIPVDFRWRRRIDQPTRLSLHVEGQNFAMGWYSTRWWRCDTSAGRGHRSHSKIGPSLMQRKCQVLLVKGALASIFPRS